MRRHLIHGAALAIGLGALLSARSVAAEDGPIIPGLESLPPVYAPPTPRSLPPEPQPSEPSLRERNVRDRQPDPFDDAARRDRATSVDRQTLGQGDVNSQPAPQRSLQVRPQGDRFPQASPQTLDPRQQALERYRQQQLQVAPNRYSNPSGTRPNAQSVQRSQQGNNPNLQDPRRDPRDPRNPSGYRLDPQRNTMQRAPQSDEPPIRVQQSTPRAQPSVQPRASQAPRNFPAWNGSGVPARTGQPSSGQRRR